jgi:hypothetical protein
VVPLKLPPRPDTRIDPGRDAVAPACKDTEELAQRRTDDHSGFLIMCDKLRVSVWRIYHYFRFPLPGDGYSSPSSRLLVMVHGASMIGGGRDSVKEVPFPFERNFGERLHHHALDGYRL